MKSLIATLGITLTLGVGTLVGLNTMNRGEVKGVKANGTTVTVYCAISDTERGDGISMKLNANVGDNNTWLQSDMTDTGHTYTSSNVTRRIYVGSFQERYGGVDALQIQRYNSSQWQSQCQPYGSWTTVDNFSGKMYVWETGWVAHTPDSYTVTFNKNSGTGGSNSVTAVYGDAMPSATAPTRTGYAFGGYWDGSGGTGTQYYNSSMGSVRNWNKHSNTTLYAKWTIISYTITFYPNGGSGSTTTRSKNYGASYTIPTPATVGIGAGAGREMLSWNTQSDGKGTTYKIDGTSTYSTNANLDLYLIQDYKSYEYSVDGGSSWVQISKTTTTEGCIATYESSPSNYLPAGQKIMIRGYYGTGSHTSQSINSWTGNRYMYEGDAYISIGTYNKMILYVRNNGNYEVDVWGGSARGVAIDRGGFVTKYECELNETTHNFTGTITVLPGDKIEAYYDYATVYAVTMTNYSSYGIDVNGNVSVPAVYVLTVTYVSENNYPSINVDSMVAVDTAKLIAQTFNTDMTPLCTNVEGGSSPSTLVTKWSTESGYYSKLSSATKNILNGTTSSSDSDVLAMRAKYDRIVGKYSGTVDGITDYMGRNPSSLSGMRVKLMTGDENIVIVVVSSVALISVAALSILIIKNKKESK